MSKHGFRVAITMRYVPEDVKQVFQMNYLDKRWSTKDVVLMVRQLCALLCDTNGSAGLNIRRTMECHK